MAQDAKDMTPEQRAAALAALAHEADVRVRKSVAIALGTLGTSAATGPLCELLADPDEGVRVLACQALGRMCDPACIPSLLAAVHDGSAQVRSGILFALASIAVRGGLAADQLAALFTPVVVMAFDPDDGVRADAAAALGTLRDARAEEPLLVLAGDAAARVRANAAASLGLLDGAAGLAELVRLACEESQPPLVRVSALDGLARRADRGSLPQDDGGVARAVDAACRLAEDAAGLEAAQATEDDHEPGQGDLVAMAVWALGYLPAQGTARDRVRQALDLARGSQDEWCRRYAAESLGRLAGRPVAKA